MSYESSPQPHSGPTVSLNVETAPESHDTVLVSRKALITLAASASAALDTGMIDKTSTRLLIRRAVDDALIALQAEQAPR